ncbi:MAG: hypothetical protein ACRYGC_15300 [Janthinobacterium lividum]
MNTLPGAARGGRKLAAARVVLGGLCLLVAAMPVPSRAATLWCSAEAGQVSFQSDIRELHDVSKAQLRKYSSRFARVVNANHDAHLPSGSGSCRTFATPGASKRALDSLRGRVSSRGMTTVTIGAY